MKTVGLIFKKKAGSRRSPEPDKEQTKNITAEEQKLPEKNEKEE